MKRPRFKIPKKCSKTGKSKIPTEKEAERARFRIWSHDTSADIYDLHVYKCDHCSTWHVGHKSYYAKELAKQMKYLCEMCEVELPEPYCLYTTGHILCGVCLPKFIEINKIGNVVVLPPSLYTVKVSKNQKN